VQYRLLSAHFNEEDKLLEADTVVGVGTAFRWSRPPTPEMEPLDDEARAEFARWQERWGENPMDPLSKMKMVGGELGDLVQPPIMSHPGERKLK
jgi:hypothetical protein